MRKFNALSVDQEVAIYQVAHSNVLNCKDHQVRFLVLVVALIWASVPIAPDVFQAVDMPIISRSIYVVVIFLMVVYGVWKIYRLESELLWYRAVRNKVEGRWRERSWDREILCVRDYRTKESYRKYDNNNLYGWFALIGLSGSLAVLIVCYV